jgi:hypothetical protein
MERCAECGFVYDISRVLAVGGRITLSVGELSELLNGAAADVSARPEPHTWSVLEYACHIRDVLLVHRERVLVARREERPLVTPMGIEERMEHDGYSGQSIVDVERQVIEAARLFANVLTRLGPRDWERTTIMRTGTNESEWSLRQVAVHAEHEVRHHLLDIRRQLARRDS